MQDARAVRGLTMTTELRRTLEGDFDAVLRAVPEALAREGFGILTEIDVTGVMREKLQVAFRRYRILGACNPPLAHRALSADPEVGLALPCNVVVYEDAPGRVVVSAVDPLEMIAGRETPELREVADTARQKLARAIAAVA